MDIWLDGKGPDHLTSFQDKIFRIVESQFYIATRKLVDSDEEQAILEEEIEKSKPNAPKSNSHGKLHYLLFTPFRYPPLRGGARFHRRYEQSIFYGSMELKTAMAEIAYRRFMFRKASAAELESAHIPYTHFRVQVKTRRAVMLTELPFKQHRERISDPVSYSDSQALGSQMRGHQVEAFTYFSARAAGGVNVGLISVEAFGQNKPVANETKEWSVYESEKIIDFKAKNLMAHETVTFHREGFYVNGVLPLLM